jgi:hypothetical protein
MMQIVRASSLKGWLLSGGYVFIVWKESRGVAAMPVSWPVFVQAVECVVISLS